MRYYTVEPDPPTPQSVDRPTPSQLPFLRPLIFLPDSEKEQLRATATGVPPPTPGAAADSGRHPACTARPISSSISPWLPPVLLRFIPPGPAPSRVSGGRPPADPPPVRPSSSKLQQTNQGTTAPSSSTPGPVKVLVFWIGRCNLHGIALDRRRVRGRGRGSSSNSFLASTGPAPDAAAAALHPRGPSSTPLTCICGPRPSSDGRPRSPSKTPDARTALPNERTSGSAPAIRRSPLLIKAGLLLMVSEFLQFCRNRTKVSPENRLKIYYLREIEKIKKGSQTSGRNLHRPPQPGS